MKDVGLAEDLAQDALVAALKRWPETGVPGNPGAWLVATARNRAIDEMRRRASLDRKQDQIGYEIDALPGNAVVDPGAAIDDTIGDDRLRLVFITCHPVLSMEARVALTLRLIGGLTTDEIARACFVAEATVAKRTLSDARYDLLNSVSPSPIVELNRAVAISMAVGPAVALELVDALNNMPSPLPATPDRDQVR